MPIIYKTDVLEALKEKGYSTYRLNKDKILGQSTITKLNKNEFISLSTLSTICDLLRCQPGDLLEWVPDDE